MDRPFKAQSATRGAPVVDLENHKAVFGQHLRAQVDRLRPAVVDHLRSRATIDRHDHRRVAGSRWPVDRCVELDAVARPKSMEFRRPKIEIDRTRGMDHVPEFAVDAANGNAGRMVTVIPDVDEAGEIGRDLDTVDAGLLRQPLRFAAVQCHAEQVSFEGRVPPPDEVELASLGVERHRGFGGPVAVGELPDEPSIRRI